MTNQAVAVGVRIPTCIIGATGYVGGELLRLVLLHPALEPAALVSRSRAGQAVAATFPHLAGVTRALTFSAPERVPELLDAGGRVAVLAAAPHGESAALLDELLGAAESRGAELVLVDLSADFRLDDAEVYGKVYGIDHGAPERIAQFHCGLPDLDAATPDGPIAHPGCFTTAVTLAAAPLQALGVAEPRYAVSAVTGSTGSGREPSATTHHPERHSDLRAYSPLRHRHVPEMERLLSRLGVAPAQVAFVPHSGPFARGIHATVHARLVETLPTEALRRRMVEFYAGSDFVSVLERPPRLKDVVGSNRCALGVETDGDRVVVMAAIDNLLKGAAGGAVQWLNRRLGLPPTAGLELPGWGWV